MLEIYISDETKDTLERAARERCEPMATLAENAVEEAALAWRRDHTPSAYQRVVL